VVLFLAAVLGGVAVVAGYVRNQVLDTNTYVATVAPLAADPVIQDALAQRLANVIVTRADLTGTVNGLASRLVEQGAPQRVTDLASPLVSGITTFLDNTISKLLATPEFEAIWQNMNRAAHQGLVTVLTGRKGQFVNSSGDTVTIDLGQLLVPLKQRLVERGITFASKIPDVSIPYTLVQSSQLPKIRTYVRVLNTVGTWLPYVALVVFISGFLITPVLAPENNEPGRDDQRRTDPHRPVRHFAGSKIKLRKICAQFFKQRFHAHSLQGHNNRRRQLRPGVGPGEL